MKINNRGERVETESTLEIVNLGTLKLLFALFVLFIMGFIFLPYTVLELRASATDEAGINTARVNIDSATWVSIATSNEVKMNVVPSANGTLVAGLSQVTVRTNALSGYALMMAGADEEINGSHYTALYLNGDRSSSAKLLGIGLESTSAAPAAFDPTTQINQWGYAIPATDENAAFLVPLGTGEGSFSPAEIYSQAVATSHTENSFIERVRFRPMSASEKTIARRTGSPTPGATGTADGAGDTLNVYYGALVGTSLTAGTYSNNVLYTAIVYGSNMTSGGVAVSPSYGSFGDTITVTTSFEGSEMGVTADQILPSLYNTRTSTSVYYGENTSEAHKIGDCINIVVDSVENGTAGHPLKFTCMVPSSSVYAGDDIEANRNYGVYTRITTGNGAGAAVSYGSNEAFHYMNLQTPELEYLQQVNASVCALTRSYNNNTITDKKNVYTIDKLQADILAHSGDGNEVEKAFYYEPYYTVKNSKDKADGSAVYGALVSDTVLDQDSGNGKTHRQMAIEDYENGTSYGAYVLSYKKVMRNYVLNGTERVLTDKRDGKKYVVRKLADDNCWMTQNLDLDLSTTTTLYGKGALDIHGNEIEPDTDINYGVASTKNHWTPSMNPTDECTTKNTDGSCPTSGNAWMANTAHKLDNTLTDITFQKYTYTNGVADYTEVHGTGPKDYVITQTHPQNGSNWLWDQRGFDGPHVYDQTESYPTDASGGIPKIKKFHTTFNGTTTAWKQGQGKIDVTTANTNPIVNCTSSYTTYTGANGTGTATSTTRTPCQDEVLDTVINYSDQADGKAYGVTIPTNGSIKFTSRTFWVDYGSVSVSMNDCANATLATGTLGYLGTTNNWKLGNWVCGKSVGGTVEQEASTELAGNYYNWFAATAGTGTAEMSSGTARDSLCPYNWQLPTYSGTKSYQNLLVEVYGATWNSNWQNWRNSHMDAIIQVEPINLIRSGGYYYGTGSLTWYGKTEYGLFWESNPYSATVARNLYFGSTYLLPQYSNYKGNGFTVRCLVR